MTALSDDPRIENFLAQIEAEYADLPTARRQRLIANLSDHLREANPEAMDIDLADPIGYARELRETLNLDAPEDAAAQSSLLAAPPPPRRRKMIVFGAGALGVIAAAIGMGIGLSGTPHHAEPVVVAPTLTPSGDGTTHMPAPQIEVYVPYVIGMNGADARLEVINAGLEANLAPDDARIGQRVVGQDPKANQMVKSGSTVTFIFAPAK